MNPASSRHALSMFPLSFTIATTAFALIASGGCTINTTASGNGTCSQDSTVTGCGADVGFSCTGSQNPAQLGEAILCSTATSGVNGGAQYCCQTSNDSCTANGSVTGCSNGSTGYSCTGNITPPESDPALSCGGGSPGASGETDYCCVSNTSSCVADSTITGCTGTSAGYSCTGSATPDQVDGSLACSTGTPSNGETLYCCVTLSTSTCMQDASVQGCQGTSFGFSCTGNDTPSQANSSLVCSAGTPSNGETLYCCTD